MIQLKKISVKSLVVLLAVLVLNGCGNSQKKGGDVTVEIEVVRIERELAQMDKYNPEVVSSDLLRTYPEFMALYTNRIINIGDTTEPYYSTNLNAFVTDRVNFELAERVEAVYADFSVYHEELSNALGRYQQYFPEKELPVVYTFISGINQSIVTGDNILGISLDKYLGQNERLYERVYPPIPNYQLQLMAKEYLVSDAIRGWVGSDILYQPIKDNFLSRILHEARVIYISEKMLPEDCDTLLWGFSAAQMKFCIESEAEMWKYLIEQKLLFSTDNFRISKFVDPGPFTKDFTRESPARAAVWIGYKIIEQYMARESDITLSELAAENDFQRLLNEARYNP